MLFWVKLLLFGELRMQICTEFHIDFFLRNKSANVLVCGCSFSSFQTNTMEPM